MRKIQTGYTLLELLIAGMIMAVLTAIAVPSYQGHVMRSNRALAQGMLSDLSLKQEAQALQHGQYAVDISALLGSGNTNATHFFLNRHSQISKALNGNGASIYKIELLEPSAASFTLRATAVGTQEKDKDCRMFTLTSVGLKSAVAFNDANSPQCWR
ncbi:MAG: type IV pilin protein [Pseudomonadota bacterium]